MKELINTLSLSRTNAENSDNSADVINGIGRSINGSTSLSHELTMRNYHMWNQKYHPVPQNYSIPKYIMRDHWVLWHFGNSVEFIAPHKFIDDKFDLCNTVERSRMSKVRVVMEKLLELAGTEEITFANEESVFNDARRKLMDLLYDDPTKLRDPLIPTIYERMLHKNIRKRKFADSS